MTLDRVLGIAGLILAIVLVVLDKAGKIRGPVLLGLLAIAAILTIPIVISIPWVSTRTGEALFAHRLLVVCIVGVVYSVTCIWIARGNSNDASQDADSRRLQVAKSPEMTEINDFICTKDEIELREEFDFQNLVKYNLRFARRNLAPRAVTEMQSEETDHFFAGGQGRIDLRYARVTSVNNRAEVQWLPGRIGVINTSAKYNQSRKKLARLYSSANTPVTVASALKDFDDAIEKNSTMLIESLNESLVSDPRSIIESERVGSPFYGSAAGLYWTKFISLSAKADAVRLALRESMCRN